MAPLPPLAAEHNNVSPRANSQQKPTAPPLRTSALSASAAPSSSSAAATVATTDGGTPKTTTPERTRSPNTSRNGHPPKIIVKKEPPTSPELSTSRHRPRKLDLSKDPSASGSQLLSSRPSGGQLTARDGPMAMQDVGLACLSPGFSTQDPTMREQLQRSISVRDHQRSIIESRLQKTAKPGDGTEGGTKTGDGNALGGLKTPGTSSRKRPPPGLSIVPPSHEQFANERVIQSAPLHQTFTGRHQPHPATRHTANQHSNLSNTSHIHHVPATQTNNRLPPITDVFASEGLGAHRGGGRNGFYQSNSASNSSHSNSRPSFPSPGHPSTHAAATTTPSARPREYRSAEEAVASMSGGREDLLPKIIHYGGHQPPTPPSPNPGLTPHKMGHLESNGNMGRSGGSRRRARAEYERDMGSPPLGGGPDTRRGPFGEGRESPESQRRKKDEFLTLCSRAWDLFHS
ncbi:hypothetical protein GP486_008035 [Trichoglossum hirsutum]|uniref:Uncharacterized protein n=1 Tax=Trichoglossum hirsutum TaxID=265104 RepID=A0A9P8L6J6_9PEZI|nr:hypothetical protein GP486_008035 [Trichoglossum hirsutum]